MTAAELRAGYLDDLGRLLAPLSPVERITVVDAVRGHLDAALAAAAAPGAETSAADAERVIAELGTAEEVAQRVLDGEPAVPAAAAPEPTPEPEPTPDPEPDLPPLALPRPATSEPRVAPGRASLADIPAMEWPEEPPPRPSLTRRWLPVVVVGALAIGSFLLLFLVPVVLSIIGVVLIWSSPLFTRRDKILGTLVPPLTVGAPSFGIIATGGGIPVWTVALCLAGLAVLAWVGMRGLKAARAVDVEYPSSAKGSARR